MHREAKGQEKVDMVCECVCVTLAGDREYATDRKREKDKTMKDYARARDRERASVYERG